MTEVEDSILVHNLDKYYQHLFPWKEFNSWLCYGDTTKFIKREFAFTFPNGMFRRYKSFHNSLQLTTYVKHKAVTKIDIGATYKMRPSIKYNKMLIEAVEKELVFDIDMNDYDNVRTCCRAGMVCSKCWKFAATACKILDALLRDDFGWKLILWVFSGRRGIHCWVCDESARNMCNEDREALISALNLRTSSNKIVRITDKRLNYHIRRSYEIAKDPFLRTCVEEQDILGSDKSIEIFVSLLPAICRDEVRKLILEVPPGKLRWIKFHIYWTNKKFSESEVWKKRPHLIEEIILWYMCPRLDTNVTVKMEHLLKAPFSVHPETKRLCVPFDPKSVDRFDIENVPRVLDFVDDAVRIKLADDEILLSKSLQVENYEKSIGVFKNFVKKAEVALSQRYVRSTTNAKFNIPL